MSVASRVTMWKTGLAVLLLPTVALAQEQPRRYVEGGIFLSEAKPVLVVQIENRFEYLGNDEFVLKEAASVDRHHWVDIEDGRVQALIVFQFEGLLEGVDGQYQFDIPEELAGSNYRFSPQLVKFGDHEFVHNTWAFDNAASAKSDPEAESARTLEFLKSKGYEMDDELIMSRHVTAVGEDTRDELIVFYMEPLSAHGRSLHDFPDGGPPSAEFDAVSDLVRERGTQAIRFPSD